jgi:hypothetical protein
VRHGTIAFFVALAIATAKVTALCASHVIVMRDSAPARGRVMATIAEQSGERHREPGEAETYQPPGTLLDAASTE